MSDALPYDLIIVGAGPAGSSCASLAAEAGLKTLLIEKARFPREKVCGDCLNPACWPVLDRLGVSDQVLALPHSRLERVEFWAVDESRVDSPLSLDGRGEIAVRRSRFDALLVERAISAGVDVRMGTAVAGVEPGWTVETDSGDFHGRFLVAADGRNSTVARLLKLLPPMRRDRVAIQTHVPAPANFGETVSMRFLADGYCGIAPVGDGSLNLCLVGQPDALPALKKWAARQFPLSPRQNWHTMTPLSRAPARNGPKDLLLIGDAARVVEPFTGEGIYYALASGELAARHLAAGDLAGFAGAHRRLYRGRLWLNRLARQAVLHPRLASMAMRHQPGLLRYLTAKVMGSD